MILCMDDITTMAAEAGFARAGATHAGAFCGYEPANGLSADPRQIMPEAASILLLAMPFMPYKPFPKGYAEVSAYYVASNRAYRAAADVAVRLEAMGVKAIAAPRIPIKPASLRAGLGVFGRNQLVCADGGGVPCALQAVLCDASVEGVSADADATSLPKGDPHGCRGCGNCVAQCPTEALADGFDRSKCLREHMMNGRVMPEWVGPLMGTRLLGCDGCMTACMERPEPEDIPSDLLDALELGGLLSRAGIAARLETLARMIGGNQARVTPILAAACVAAGNAGDASLVPALDALSEDENEVVRVHAAWAAERLRGGR